MAVVPGLAPKEYTNIRGITPVVPTERLIVALDFPGAAEALSLVEENKKNKKRK